MCTQRNYTLFGTRLLNQGKCPHPSANAPIRPQSDVFSAMKEKSDQSQQHFVRISLIYVKERIQP
jgi:hypothetical protein